jgi:tetratricopeptide (TPR) repeat protein
MNRKPKDKKKSGFAQYGKWGAVIVLAVAFFVYRATRHPAMAAQGAGVPAAQAQKQPQSLWDRYVAAWNSTEDKMAEIRTALEENERLRYENANLRLKLETSEFDCHEKEAASDTQKISAKLTSEAGSSVARTLASITYKPPTNLLPNQLYTLGVTYFKAHEDEKAAVIFSFLTGMEDNTAYQTPRNYLMAGVAWYRVDNFEMADFYLDKALQQPENDNNLQFQAQARLWKGLVAQHQGKEKDAQHWLRELVDHHPHSQEAEWVNGEHREPASSQK